MQVSKRVYAMFLLFNVVVLLWMLGYLTICVALRYRLVFLYVNSVAFIAITAGLLLIALLGWCILGLCILCRRNKTLGIITSALWTAAVIAMMGFLLPGLILGLGMSASSEWKTVYCDSPEGTNTLVIFWGGDTGAATSGPYYAVFPMVCKGIYRYCKGNETERMDCLEYVSPTVEWLSEKEARVHCGSEEIIVVF